MVKVTEQAVNHLETANSNVSRHGYITIAVGLGDRVTLKVTNPDERVLDRVIMTRYIASDVKYRFVLKNGDRLRVNKNTHHGNFGAPLPEVHEYVFNDHRLHPVVYSGESEGYVNIPNNTLNTACVYTYVEMQTCLFGDSFPARMTVTGIGIPRMSFILTQDKTLPTKLNPHDLYFGLTLTDDGWTSAFTRVDEGYKDFDIIVVPSQRRGMIDTYAFSEETQERFKWLVKSKFKLAGIESSISHATSGAQLFFKPLVTE